MFECFRSTSCSGSDCDCGFCDDHDDIMADKKLEGTEMVCLAQNGEKRYENVLLRERSDTQMSMLWKKWWATQTET